jgi:hypothetical protein
MTKFQRAWMPYLSEHPGATASDLQGAVEAAGYHRQWSRAAPWYLGNGFVTREGDGGSKDPYRYRLSEAGRGVLAAGGRTSAS